MAPPRSVLGLTAALVAGAIEFTAVAAEVTAPQLARIHAIWGIGQLIRREAAKDEALTALFNDPDPEVRAQAIKTVTDRYGRLLGLDRIPAPTQEGHALTSTLLPKLNDPSQRVRLQTLLGLGRLRDTAATGAIISAVIGDAAASKVIASPNTRPCFS